jgi:hypothetical protein
MIHTKDGTPISIDSFNNDPGRLVNEDTCRWIHGGRASEAALPHIRDLIPTTALADLPRLIKAANKAAKRKDGWVREAIEVEMARGRPR